MAQISIYIDEKTAVKFWQIEDKQERADIRKVAQAVLIKEINKVPEEAVEEDTTKIEPLY